MTQPFDTAKADALEASALEDKACLKWQHHPVGVLPLWVADMDFPTAKPIQEALEAYAKSNNLGYPSWEGLPGLRESVQRRLEMRYGWEVEPPHIYPLNGIVTGLFLGCLALASEGEEVIVQSPIYPPFMMAVEETGRVPLYNPLVQGENGWEMDFDGLEALVTPATRLLMLCNPHNPTGRVFRRAELERLADFALRHRLWVVSDELHSDLVYEGETHIPIASLSEEIAERTVTLFGPTKTFNIAGLKIGFAVSQNEGLLERFKARALGLVGEPNVMAQAATMAAYGHGEAWLEGALTYLDGNRRSIKSFLDEHLPEVGYTLPEGTYLAWLDFRAWGLGDELYPFLLEEAKVGLNDGPAYGPGGEGFARLNFATSRGIVEEALTRIRDARRARV